MQKLNMSRIDSSSCGGRHGSGSSETRKRSVQERGGCMLYTHMSLVDSSGGGRRRSGILRAPIGEERQRDR